MQLRRALGVTHQTARFMAHRLRDARTVGDLPLSAGRGRRDLHRRAGEEKANKKLRAGRGAVGKTAVAGIRDCQTGEVRAQVVDRTDGKTLRGFVEGSTVRAATVFTDEARAYCGLNRRHQTGTVGRASTSKTRARAPASSSRSGPR